MVWLLLLWLGASLESLELPRGAEDIRKRLAYRVWARLRLRYACALGQGSVPWV